MRFCRLFKCRREFLWRRLRLMAQKNAALLAVQMIALKDERLAKQLKDYKLQMEKKVLDDEQKLLEELKL